MTVSELCTSLKGTIFATPNNDKDVTQATVGDLLSFVMGNAPEGAVWITIQSHLNLAAVAVLKELPMIIIASGREPATDLVERCKTEKITLMTVPSTIYDTCRLLANMGIEG